ncbi:MAG: DNRLRE domain-containing protein [Chitinophagaceae bacterium]|nr:DNRLRE domain-containing protein [Chitinophagaceae bacterium]
MKSVIKTLGFCLLISIAFTACQKDIVNTIIQNAPSADAGLPQTVQLPAASFTLTGTGTTTNGVIVGYLWSLVSGPNVPVIISPASPSTSVINIVAGTYRFQFMVIDQAGLTGVDTVTVTVLAAAVQTLVLQPANNVNEVHLGFWNGDYTNSADVEFAGCAWTSGGSPLNTRGLFKFDLSSIPANATILTAKLSLYSMPAPLLGNFIDANFGTNNALYLERVTANWTPGIVTWQTQPGTDFGSQITIPHTNQSFFDLIDIDVKNLVIPMATVANYGFKIRLQNEVFYNIRVFSSSRFGDASKHPKLVITYQ